MRGGKRNIYIYIYIYTHVLFAFSAMKNMSKFKRIKNPYEEKIALKHFKNGYGWFIITKFSNKVYNIYSFLKFGFQLIRSNCEIAFQNLVHACVNNIST